MTEGRIGKQEMKRRIYDALVSELENGCMIDSDDPEFIDFACEIQNEIAIRLRLKTHPPRSRLQND